LELVGRQAELVRVELFLDSLASGSAKLLVQGEPGIGKTSVWRSGVDAAIARGVRVLRSCPAESESSLSYAGLADLLTGIEDEAVRLLPDAQRDALERALLRRAADFGSPDSRAVFTAFATVLRGLCERVPVVVAVDDLQWLDGPSARALEFAGRRVRDLRIGVLATVRSGANSTMPLPRSWFDPDDCLRLPPLTAAALHRLVRDRLGWSLPRPTLLRLSEACAGNAFYALEIARQLTAEGASGQRNAWPIPVDVRDLVDSRVKAVAANARGELLLAAAASQPTVELFDPAVLEIAESAELVLVEPGGRVRFAHPLYASAIYSGASAEQRRRAHELLALQEPDMEERARHLGQAATDPDEKVADELDRGARRARARGASEIAAELQERAFELTPDPNDARERALAASADWYQAGALARSRALLLALLDGASEQRLRARALRLLAQVRFHQESVLEAMELMAQAAAEAGDVPDLRTPIELDLAYGSVSVSFDFDAARPHADAALAHAERQDDGGLLAQALAVKTMVDFLLGAGIDAVRLESALRLEQPNDDMPVELRPTFIAGCLAFYTGQFDRARSLLYPLRMWLRDRGRDSELPAVLTVIVWLECWSGNLQAAAAAAEEAIDAAALTGSEAITGIALAHAAFADAHAGRVVSCRARASSALSSMERAGYGVHAVWSLSALGLLELSLSEPAAACQAFEPLLAWCENDLPAEPIRAFFLPDAIEALVAIGQFERASALNLAFNERGRRLDRTWALATSSRCDALLLASQGDLPNALASVEAAIASLKPFGMPVELARALLIRGQLERRLKRKAAARESLERAASICEQVGAVAWTARAHSELARLGAVRARSELTETEERIAKLAAAGLTNREIAAAAFVSQKTVEANLSRIYRKLGIRSRAELGLRLAIPITGNLTLPDRAGHKREIPTGPSPSLWDM
jgi:DNA-binding CsgD family transcriptional regulator